MTSILNEYTTAVFKATSVNDHTSAIVLMAQYVTKKHNQLQGVDKLVKYAMAVETLQDFYGHMPASLNEIRDEVGDRIESFLSSDEKAAFDKMR